MSGGSFNYLYCKSASEMLAAMGDLRQMTELLEAEFPNSPAALDTRALFDRLLALKNAIDGGDEQLTQLTDKVWFSAEWWQSGDYGRDAVEKAVAEYKPTEQRRRVPDLRLVCGACVSAIQVEEDLTGRWYLEDHPVALLPGAPLCIGSGGPKSRA